MTRVLWIVGSFGLALMTASLASPAHERVWKAEDKFKECVGDARALAILGGKAISMDAAFASCETDEMRLLEVAELGFPGKAVARVRLLKEAMRREVAVIDRTSKPQ